MSGVTAATIFAGVGAAAAVAGTAYTLFGSKPGASGGQTALPAPPPPPTPLPPVPNRSDADVQGAAAKQRAKYGVGAVGSQDNNPTGGLGVPQSSTYSAVTALLGGGGDD